MHKVHVERDNLELQLNADGSAFFGFHLTPEQVAQLQEYLEGVDFEPRTSIVIDNPVADNVTVNPYCVTAWSNGKPTDGYKAEDGSNE